MEKFFKQIDQIFFHDEIDVFLEHLNESVKRTLKKLNEEAKNLTEDQFEDPLEIEGYRMHLFDLAYSAEKARDLGYELSIIALYKKVEHHTNRVVKHFRPDVADRKLANFKWVANELPFKLELVEGFKAVDELRLLNNSIKHNGSLVPKNLAAAYPRWQEGAKLSSLDQAYKRLLPGVKSYIVDFVGRRYSDAQA